MKQLAADIPWLEKLGGLIRAVARSYGLEPCVVAALISRESGGGRLLGRRGNPPDTGDNGHGRGLMQIDDRWHKEFIGIGDLWRKPAANIAYGCYLIELNLAIAERGLAGRSKRETLRAALAGYNCGMSRAMKALMEEGDPDLYTTGADYSKDVMERSERLRKMGLF